jgi:hypothetical protein
MAQSAKRGRFRAKVQFNGPRHVGQLVMAVASTVYLAKLARGPELLGAANLRNSKVI